MKASDLKIYRCPACASSFSLKSNSSEDILLNSELICEKGHCFDILAGIPDFTWPKELGIIDQQTKDLYSKLAGEYDKFANLPFQTFYEDENNVRSKMTDRLNLKAND